MKSIWNVLESLTGSINGPWDWSRQHDHYLYGTPKRGKEFMNVLLVIGILESALNVLSELTTGKVKVGVDIATELEQIVHKAAEAYRQQTGLELNPDLVRPFEPLP